MSHTKSAQRLIPRAYLVCDLDNLCFGCCNVSPEMIVYAANSLLDGLTRAGINLKNSLTAVAYGVEAKYRNPAFLTAWPNSPRPRLLQGNGVNGADERILDVLKNDPGLRRSQTVIVASGDGIYSGAVDDLNALGIKTIVASYPKALSAKLKIACSSSIELPEPPSIETGWIA